MALLCTFVVAQSVLDVLSQQNLYPDQLDRLADQFECIREVLQQVQIADEKGALSKAMNWMRHMLFAVRALLSGWHVDDSSPRLLIEDPLPQFPRIHKDVWTVMHPNREKFYAEARYCAANLLQQTPAVPRGSCLALVGRGHADSECRRKLGRCFRVVSVNRQIGDDDFLAKKSEGKALTSALISVRQ